MKTEQTPETQLTAFLKGKSEQTLSLLEYFVNEYKKIGKISLHPTKTMIGISRDDKRIAWITQPGKSFIQVVFPFRHAYPDNLCFQKIAQVPDDIYQYNHHLRIYHKEDLNEEVLGFMRWAYEGNF